MLSTMTPRVRRVRQYHRLRELMEQRGIRAEQLGVRCGVSSNTVYNWKFGYSVIPSDQLEPLTRALDVTVEELLGWPESAAPPARRATDRKPVA